MSDQKKERPQLGLAIPVTNKAKASSYDLKGNIMIDGKSYRFGAYKAQAKGNGKLAQKKFELPISMAKTVEFFIQKGHEEFKADANRKAK